MKTIEDQYLGDGVYVSFDGFHVWLDTRAQTPVNRIALDPSVLEALERFIATLRATGGDDVEDDG